MRKISLLSDCLISAMFIHFGEGNHKDGVNLPGEGTWPGREKAGQKAPRCFLALPLLGNLNFSDPQVFFFCEMGITTLNAQRKEVRSALLYDCCYG